MKHGCVVIADIHQSMLEGIRGLLDTVFDTTVMVASISSLRKTAEKLNPDLVVMDLSMPPSEGSNVVKEFVSSCPGTRLIVMSVHDEMNVCEKIISSGASGFVLKRRAGIDLLDAAEEVLKGNTYISPIYQKGK